MKNLKSVLAVLMALCLMICLAVPVFATGETTGAAAETTAATVDTTGAAEETTGATVEATEGAEVHDHDHDHEDTTTTGESVKESPSVIKIIFTVLEVITSIVLIVVVMLQSGKESGLSSALSGNADSYLSKSGKSLDKVLAKATKWVALVWLVLTLTVCLLP